MTCNTCKANKVCNHDIFGFENCNNYIPDKADFVEVVRCSQCKYGRKIDKNRSPEKYFRNDCVVCECEDVVEDEPMIYLPTHFCSYGKRRDT